MKRFLLIMLASILLFGCGSHVQRMGLDENLPKYDILGVRDGKIWLKDGKVLHFTKAVFTCNPKMIRVQSEMIYLTVIWMNVKKVEINNE